jgi:hypothetical protein
MRDSSLSRVAAAATSLAARLVLVAVLLLGTATGMLPWVIDIMLPLVVVILVLGEALACRSTPCRATGSSSRSCRPAGSPG